MNLTYTPEQCQAARVLESDIVQLSAEAEKLRFLIDFVDDAVFEPEYSNDALRVLAHEVNRNAPGISLAQDCLNSISEVLERMNWYIRMSNSQ